MAITKVSSGVISANAVTATIVAENVITSSEIATNGVGTLQIADDAVTSAKLDTNIDIAGTLDVTGILTADSNVVIAGNLTVNGSTVTNSSTNTTIEDALIELGTGTTGTPANDAGIIIERGDSNNAFMGFDESADKFIVATTTATGASTGNLSLTAAPLVTGALTASGLSYPTSDGSANQVIKTDGSGNLSFATVVTGGAVVHNYTATGDGSTATFDTGINPQDEVNTWVHIDGVYQNKSEYSYNGTSITFSTAPDSGAAIDIISGTQSGFSTADSVLGVYSATTTDTATYDTGLSASTENNVNIFIEGVYQPKSTYTWSGSTITFDANTPTGLALEVIASKTLTAGAVVTASITDSAVTTAKIANNAITSAKIVNNSITGADISATTNIVANTFTGALTGNVTGNVTGNLTGTIQTAAQTNITSVGTLTGLTTSGNVNITGNIDASGLLKVGTNDSEYANNYIRFKPAGAAYIDHSTTSQDINFRVSNSSALDTTPLVIKADGKIGIGTSGPDGELHVLGTGGGNGDIYVERTSGAKIHLQAQSANGKIGTSSNHNLGLNTNGTTRVTIDTNGKVLIGDTASHTADLLQIETPASGGGHGIQIRRNDSNNDQGIGHIQFGNNTDTDLAKIAAITDGSTDNARLTFHTQPNGGALTERMRITSVGNLLVGTTSTTVGGATSGYGFRVDGANGIVQAAASGNTSAIFNRTSSDGAIVSLRKNGSEVGNIGANGGMLTVGGGDCGLYFEAGTTNVLFPYNPSTSSTSDNDITIGWSSNRFKDLYLSGGVYLGGTGSANKLDDYEEGTWTPSLAGNNSNSGQSYGTQSGTYTKIGRQVTCRFSLVLSAEGSFGNAYIKLIGFPFNTATGVNNVHMGNLYFSNMGSNYISIGLQAHEGTNQAFLWAKKSATTSREYVGTSDLSDSTELTGTFTYFI